MIISNSNTRTGSGCSAELPAQLRRRGRRDRRAPRELLPLLPLLPLLLLLCGVGELRQKPVRADATQHLNQPVGGVLNIAFNNNNNNNNNNIVFNNNNNNNNNNLSRLIIINKSHLPQCTRCPAGSQSACSKSGCPPCESACSATEGGE
jgi:hypothetical protein